MPTTPKWDLMDAPHLWPMDVPHLWPASGPLARTTGDAHVSQQAALSQCLIGQNLELRVRPGQLMQRQREAKR
jgi:hypothetical protein